jgi:hypothetical protein
VVVLCGLGLVTARAAGQPLQPGGDNVPERHAERFYRFPGWTARPTPAIKAGFGAAPPSASVKTTSEQEEVSFSRHPRRQSGAC